MAVVEPPAGAVTDGVWPAAGVVPAVAVLAVVEAAVSVGLPPELETVLVLLAAFEEQDAKAIARMTMRETNVHERFDIISSTRTYK